MSIATEKAKEVRGRIDEKVREARDLMGTGTASGRLPNDEERTRAAALLAEAKTAKKEELDPLLSIVEMEGELSELGKVGLPDGSRKASGDVGDFGRNAAFKDVGAQIVDFEGFERIRDPKKRVGSWTTGPMELKGWESMVGPTYLGPAGAKTTLDSSGGSGGALIQPDVQAGILPILFRRLTVADLLAPGSTDSNLVRYLKETTATNAAAPVAEGAAKPESTLVFSAVDEPVRKIATFLPVSDEMLEDYSQIRSYINARLGLFVRLAEEDQLLNGTGVAPAILGLTQRAGLTAAQAKGADSIADAVFKEIMKIYNASFLMPDAIVFNPLDWQDARLEKDAQGQYYGGGPFAGPISRSIDGGVIFDTYWGLPVVVTPAQTNGTAFLGAFSTAAQIFRRTGLTVETSNSHQDFFQKNLTAIRAEERLALAVYRPAAFGTVTGI
jgi:HK97 family phage major capsid protein